MQASLQTLIKRIRDIRIHNKMMLSDTRARMQNRVSEIYKKINSSHDFMTQLNKELTQINNGQNVQSLDKTSQTLGADKPDGKTLEPKINGPKGEQTLSQDMLQQVIQSGLKNKFGSSAPLIQSLLQKHLQNQSLMGRGIDKQ